MMVSLDKGISGGATDYYKMKAENIYYYDVNSLYPFAMMKPMPYELLRKVQVFENNFNLNLPYFTETILLL